MPIRRELSPEALETRVWRGGLYGDRGEAIAAPWSPLLSLSAVGVDGGQHFQTVLLVPLARPRPPRIECLLVPPLS
jgi:hypothetical protein